MTREWLVGIDVGGTFTDVVALRLADGAMRSAKVASRPDDPVCAIANALDAVVLAPDDIENLVHGTTRVTNAIVEEKLPPVAMVTTSGFEDTLAIARLRRRELYRLDIPPRRAPLVPAERCFGVDERLDHRGEVLRALDTDSLEATLAALEQSGAASVAVSLLHAYANPVHEQAVGARVRERFRHVSLSHEVNPEAREYERGSSTVLNAATMPIVIEYVDDLLERLGLDRRLQLFQSAGGWATPHDVRRRPLSMALSGPAAGVAAGAKVSGTIERDNVLTFDMGGTTTDVCLIVDGEAQITDSREIGDRPVRQPMVAVHSIGAGGGSIARLTPGGLLVGPDSAGAEPGPACYGTGGTQATVTDANLLLGYLTPARRLGASIDLDPQRAVAAIEPIADALGRGLVETALGIVRVANANMARALRRVTVERGIDGRRCTLLAFGGAGPMHAVGLAESFGIQMVVVPAQSGAFSALGCLLSDMAYAHQRTVRIDRADWDGPSFERLVDDALCELTKPLREAGVDAGNIETELIALVRYEGQSDAVPVPFARPLDPDALGREFTARHHALYGYSTDEPWILEGLRLRVAAPSKVSLSAMPSLVGAATPVETPCWFDAAGATQTPRIDRAHVSPGVALDGPAVVEDAWSTIVIPPRWRSTADAYGNLHITQTGR